MSDFAALFTGRTLRIDTLHGASRAHEEIRVVGQEVEGPFQGTQELSQEPARLGDYRYTLLLPTTGETLHADGYSSFFEEWRSTSESADGAQRFFHESIRLPCPRVPVVLRIEAVEEAGACRLLLEQPIAPPTADAAPTDAPLSQVIAGALGDGRLITFLFVSEGYAEADEAKFHADAVRFGECLLSAEPYRSLRDRLQVRALFVPSVDSGISDPRAGKDLQTLLHASFNTFGIDRYMLTFDNQRLRQVCAREPYHVLTVLCNTAKYGGGGVFNQYACLATDTPYGPYLLLHELGHSFAGLGDEYFAAHVTYDTSSAPPPAPWHPNITTTPDRAQLKWSALVAPATPLPTPWDQERYCELVAACNAEAERTGGGGVSDHLQALVQGVQAQLRGEPRYGQVGAFEGALYRRHAVFRPELDCLMFGRSAERFCRVCEHTIASRIEALLR